MDSGTYNNFQSYLKDNYSHKFSWDVLSRCKRIENLLNIELSNIQTQEDYISIVKNLNKFIKTNLSNYHSKNSLQGTLLYSVRVFLKFKFGNKSKKIIKLRIMKK